ncbi:hypothetical protein L210DRAFT_3364666, partial [Boletus edulis BED1]
LLQNDLDAPDQFRSFQAKDGYIRLKTEGRNTLCVPKILVDGRSIRECLIERAHSL